mgnify:CR=1 FL=1
MDYNIKFNNSNYFINFFDNICINKYWEQIKGILIENIDVSNLTIEEANSLLNEITDKEKENEIIFKYKEVETPITYEALEVEFDIKEKVEKAYQVGRGSNIIKNNFEILSTWINGNKYELEASFDENVIKQVCENINNTSEDAIVEPSYYIENDKLIITPGKKGIDVNESEVKNMVTNILNINSEKSTILEVPVSYKEPQAIDLEKIHNEIYKKAQDAYYTNNPFTIYPEVKGIDFDIESAKSIIEEEKEEYEIPLIITQPDKTVNDIGTEELAHLEMVGTIVHQLTRGASIEEIEKAGLGAYYTDHGVDIYPQSAAGVPFDATCLACKGDVIANLQEDLAAEQKARATYEKLIDLCRDNPDVIDPLRFLREREIVHFQRFGEALRIVQDKLSDKKFCMNDMNNIMQLNNNCGR